MTIMITGTVMDETANTIINMIMDTGTRDLQVSAFPQTPRYSLSPQEHCMEF